MVKSNGKNTEMYMHSNDICHCRGLRDLFCHVESVNIEMFENTESVMLCSFLEAQRSTKVPNEQRQASGIFVVNNELVIGIMVNEGYNDKEMKYVKLYGIIGEYAQGVSHITNI